MRYQYCMVVAAFCLASSSLTAQPIKATAIQYPIPGTPAAAATEAFITEVEARSGGALHITKKAWESSEHSISAIQTGAAEFAIASTPAIARIEHAFEIFELPFLFEDLGAVSRFQRGKGGQILGARLKERGLVALALVHEDMSVVVAKEALRSPGEIAQLKGLTFAAGAYYTPTTKLWNKLGGTVALASSGDIFLALQRSTANSYLGPTTLMETLPSSIRVITLTRHEYVGFVLLARAEFLGSLTPNLRKDVRAAAQHAQERANALSIELLARKNVELMKAGAQLVPLKRRELDAWRKAAGAEWSAFEAKGDSLLLRLALASGTGGGGDPCAKLNECRCPDRTCNQACCIRPSK